MLPGVGGFRGTVCSRSRRNCWHSWAADPDQELVPSTEQPDWSGPRMDRSHHRRPQSHRPIQRTLVRENTAEPWLITVLRTLSNNVFVFQWQFNLYRSAVVVRRDRSFVRCIVLRLRNFVWVDGKNLFIRRLSTGTRFCARRFAHHRAVVGGIQEINKWRRWGSPWTWRTSDETRKTRTLYFGDDKVKQLNISWLSVHRGYLSSTRCESAAVTPFKELL